MKTLNFLIVVGLGLLITTLHSCNSSSDLSKTIRVPGAESGSLSDKYTKAVSKRALSEAKKLKKQGYYVAPMALPIDAQLTKVYLYEGVTDEIGNRRYITERASVKSRSKTAGKQHAIEACKIYIAGYMQSHIMGLVKSDLSNQELSTSEAESISKMVSSYENWIAANLGPVNPVAVFYRDEKGGILDVSVCVSYDLEYNLERVRNKTLRKLEDDTDIARERLEEVFDSERFRNIESIQ